MEIEKATKSGPCYVRQRYVLAVLCFLGLINVSCLRNNVYITILVMVNTTHLNTTHSENLNWNNVQEGTFLGSYYYGYALGNLPGSLLAMKFGGRNIFGVCIAVSAVLGILTPAAVNMNFYLSIACRILTGFLHASALPSCITLLANWAPPFERSIMQSTALSGILFGFIVIYPVAGAIILYIGWEAVFYITGGACIFWVLFLFGFGAESPARSRLISVAEKELILTSLGRRETNPNTPPIPWKSVFTSKCIWGLFAAHFADAWFQYTLPAILPMYFLDVLHYDILQSSFLMMLPFVAQFIVAIPAGRLTDLARSNGWVSTTCIRKFNTCFGLLVPGILTAAIGYEGNMPILTVITFTLSFGVSGLSYAGYLSNTLDIAPRYAGIIWGVSNTQATVAGFLGPLFASSIVTDKTSLSQWRSFYWLTCGVCLSGALAFGLLGSGKEQDWAKVETEVHLKLNPTKAVV